MLIDFNKDTRILMLYLGADILPAAARGAGLGTAPIRTPLLLLCFS